MLSCERVEEGWPFPRPSCPTMGLRAPKPTGFCLATPKIKWFIFKDGGGLGADAGDTNEKVSSPKIPWLKPRSYPHGSAEVAVLATGGRNMWHRPRQQVGNHRRG